MYCKNCGAEIQEGQKFCPKCGTPVEEVSENDANRKGQEAEAVQSESHDADANAVPVKSGSGNRTRTILIIVAVVVVIVAALVIGSILLKTTIDLNEYTTVSFEGYDGYGTAKVHIDYEAITKDYEEKVKLASDSDLGEIVKSQVEVSLSASDDLSNGGTVKVSYKVNEEKLKELTDCNFKYESEEYTVSGLTEVSSIDVFEGIEVSFDGISPDGDAEVIVDKYYSYCDYKVVPSTGLANGDEVMVTFTVTDQKDFINQYGGLPETKSKTYTVSGLDEWITDITQLSEDNVNAILKEAQEQIEAYQTTQSYYSVINSMEVLSGDPAQGYYYELNVYEPVLENIYILTRKDETSSGEYSDLIVLDRSEINVYTDETKSETAATGNVYFTVQFTDLMLQDGELTGLTQCNVSMHNDKDYAYQDVVSSLKNEFNVVGYDADLQKIE